MSVPEPVPDGAPPGSTPTPPPRSARDQVEIAKLDAISDRIKRAVPEAPYILSTPSLHPYSHWSRQEAHSWMMGHLFDPHEEHLQYRTYLYREPYQDCFVLQPGEDDLPPPDRSKSQALNTSSQAPKKKISLSAYKSKQANGVITPGSKKVSPTLAPTKPDPAQVNGFKASEKQPLPAQKSPSNPARQHPTPESLVPGKPEKRPPPKEPTPEPPHKGDLSELKPTSDVSVPSNGTPHGLPPLLSPVGPSLHNPYDLPPILSPTLPSNVQAELDRLETQRKRAESNASTSSSDKRDKLLSAPDPRSEKREDLTRIKSRVRSVSMNGTAPTGLPTVRTNTSEPTLVVKLKYPKRSSATIERILRLQPPRKPATTIDKKERPVKSQIKASDAIATKTKEAPKTTARRPESTVLNARSTNSKSTTGPQKRPRDEDETLSAVAPKRQKAQVSNDPPSTPSEQIIFSPTLSNKSSAQRSQALSQGQYVTPRKDLIANKMIRTTSAEGDDSTPGRSGVTPSSSKHLDVKPAPTSAPINGKKPADIHAFQRISMKLNTLGRSLKHESQRFVEKGSQISKDDQKRAAVTSIECILSYMAAYHVQDISRNLSGRPGEVENTWKTLLPLCMSYSVRTRDFPHLDGLRSYLSSVISGSICTHIAHRFRSISAQAHDSPHDAPTSESANPNLKLLADNVMNQQRFTQDARIGLPSDDIERLFPKTWAGREKVAKLARETEKLAGGHLNGPYFLPVGSDTTPIQAVRFGLAFLKEYSEKESLNYSTRVNLERPE
ncbi:uncharacterized protein BDR25DRAFT_313926 [Lindgomyces ingoldianus]|uniref:Uncharacterized protein n=1 Tax=Lindgomyces ingoldianus TaxID=673940 RepID=A0ACB6QYH3_9PLEO|nr:uncharacterized protein BDR25DRAFT_313926 [Lindgomyces ingoldianus]KAF2471327.1 hypothetical protein BDR25DRAFT_313926 [Lindgomyces ingoldianus]